MNITMTYCLSCLILRVWSAMYCAVLSIIVIALGCTRLVQTQEVGKHALDCTYAEGSPEYFRNLCEQFIYSALGREAIAPLWEVQTARLQTQAGSAQAGLTEVQRAQRNNQLAAVPDATATTKTWRPILLDLNGDGVQTVSKDAAHVAFDVDAGNDEIWQVAA